MIRQRLDMTMTSSRRGRKRVRDSDDTEFIPISKKLNNLHLEEGTGIRSQDSADLRNGSPQTLPSAPYQPSLPVGLNPVYYEMNRILYEAHQMRRIRSSGAD